MWLHTQFGFFSITRPAGNKKVFQVRARLRADLEALICAAHQHRPAVPQCPLVRDILVGAGTDYKYRIIVEPSTLAGIMLMLVATTTYSNFKDHIASLPGQKPKLRELHEIWSMGLGWQMDERAPHIPVRAGSKAAELLGGQQKASTLFPSQVKRPAKKGQVQ